MEEPLNQIAAYLEGAIAVQLRVASTCTSQIHAAANAIAAAFNTGNKLLLCGNGGSAADCQHMAAEFVSNLSRDLTRPGLPAVALTTDSSFLTGYANDHGFDRVFERQVRTLGRPGDVLLAISTSGRSANVRRAVCAARAHSMVTVGLMGCEAPLEAEVDYPVVVPDRDVQHVQEALLPIEHLICLLVEGRGRELDPKVNP